ncbi:MAG TPA: porin [Vicinamibacterales bacterium]|nr:porin [Vicinamibacterales bacterium]
MTRLRVASLAFLTLLASAPAAFAQTQDTPMDEPTALEPAGAFQGAGLLIIKTPDERFKWWLDGRLNIDSAFYLKSDNNLANGIELRRARLATNMVLWKDWAAQFDVDYVDNAVDVKDAWIGYIGVPNTLVRLGNFKTPFGLETLTSSRYITFMERSLIDNFSPDRHIGVGASHWGKRYTAAGGFFGPELADTVDTIGQDQTYSLIGRVTALPYANGDNVVHLGAAVAWMQPKAATSADLSDANRWRVRARPETNVNRGRFITTPQVKNVDHADLYGAEAAATYGSLSVQAEYNHEVLKRTASALPEPAYDGGYAFVSWFPTGDHRPYDRASGEFGRVLPKSSRGAIELAVRYSMMDLNDPSAAIAGGLEKIVTLGVNWYCNANVRIMTNYLFVNNDNNAKGDRSYKPGDDFNVLQMRLAVMF